MRTFISFSYHFFIIIWHLRSVFLALLALIVASAAVITRLEKMLFEEFKTWQQWCNQRRKNPACLPVMHPFFIGCPTTIKRGWRATSSPACRSRDPSGPGQAWCHGNVGEGWGWPIPRPWPYSQQGYRGRPIIYPKRLKSTQSILARSCSNKFF